jgi:8-oxo-dGTP pyrophosphatase MutT (NUDIX family)
MSVQFHRLSQLYTDGFDREAPELFGDYRIGDIEVFTPAAVLIAVTERAEPGVLLLHRPSNMRAHPGQIAFPGGKIDPGETPVEAALREAHEELGIRTSDVQIIGTGDVYRTGSAYEITPVLAVVPPDIDIQPNPMEVAQWFEAPLDHMLNPANHSEQWAEWEGGMRPYYEIIWQEHNTWGVTAALIVNLARRLRWHG